MSNAEEEYEIIFRPYRRLPDGTVIWAKWFGLKAFPIRIRKGKAVNPKATKGNEKKE